MKTIVAPLTPTPPCEKYGKEEGHMTRKDQGLFWECECGFCWWKDESELPPELRAKGWDEETQSV